MKKTTLVAVVLGILVVISVVQAFQLNDLKSDIDDGEVISTTNSVSESSADTRTKELPSSIQNLPQMVGGC